MSKPKKIVIVGGGIMGCSVAYYLCNMECHHQVTLIEKHEIACHSSGKAGGFLAKDWLDDEIGTLGKMGYNIHAQLGKKHQKDTLYRTLDTWDVKATTNNINSNKKPFKWVKKEIVDASVTGTKSSTAQVYIILYIYIKYKVSLY